VSKDELLGIGAFALLSGLTIATLRHYHEIGLFKPASVDPSTRYRYYRPEQVLDAQPVRALRALDLPLNHIKDILEKGDDASTRAYLVAHRADCSPEPSCYRTSSRP
jgi:DNA-binding transcriptional MerR regulator